MCACPRKGGNSIPRKGGETWSIVVTILCRKRNKASFPCGAKNPSSTKESGPWFIYTVEAKRERKKRGRARISAPLFYRTLKKKKR